MDCPTCLKSGDKRGDSDLIWGRLRSNIILLKGKDLKKKKKLSFPNFCKLIQVFFVIFFVRQAEKNTYFFDLIWTRLRSCLLGLAVDRGEIWKVFQFPQTHKSLLELDWMKWSVSLICTNTLNLQFGHNFRFWINSFENSNSRKPLRAGLTGMILPLREAVWLLIQTWTLKMFEIYSSGMWSEL